MVIAFDTVLLYTINGNQLWETAMLMFFLTFLFKLPGPWNWGTVESVMCEVTSSQGDYDGACDYYHVVELKALGASTLGQMTLWSYGTWLTRVELRSHIIARIKRNRHSPALAKVVDLPSVPRPTISGYE